MKARTAAAIALALAATLIGREIPRPPTHVYNLYVPLMEKPRDLSHGLAGTSYPELVGAHWYHGWSWCEGDCVPAIMDWSIPPQCTDWLILGNEPEAQGEGHSYFPAAQAAWWSREIRKACPETRLIVGGTIQGGTDWLDVYLQAGGVYDRLGTHCYAYDARTCETLLAQFAEHFDKPVCVTEFNVLNGNVLQFLALYHAIDRLTDCYSVFTDVQDAWWWGEGVDASLITDGQLNELGRAYGR